MPFESITQWLAQVLAPTGAIGFILYLALKKFIESKFEKGLEETRSENRRKEDEIKQLREFMSSLKRERGSRIHAKKIEAAEQIIKSRNELSKLSPFVEIMRTINIDYALHHKDQIKIGNLISTFSKPMRVNETAKAALSVDIEISFLYLSNQTIDIYNAYRCLIFEVVGLSQILENKLGKKDLVIKTPTKTMELIKRIYPKSDEKFEKYGYQHSYYYMEQLYDDILKTLRKELLDEQSSTHDYDTTAHLMKQLRILQEENVTPDIPKEILKTTNK